MRCPRCDSTNAKTLPMIYGSGSSKLRLSSIWITGKGRVATRFTGGSRQTRTAEAAAPPRAPSVILGFFGMVFLAVIACVVIAKVITSTSISAVDREQMAALTPYAMFSASIVIFFTWVFRHRGKKKQYLRRLGSWEQAWCCLRCGNTWIP